MIFYFVLDKNSGDAENGMGESTVGGYVPAAVFIHLRIIGALLPFIV